MICYKYNCGWKVDLPCLKCSQYGCSGSISEFVYEDDSFDDEADVLNYAEQLREEKQIFCYENV
jgi:hypothetical protein